MRDQIADLTHEVPELPVFAPAVSAERNRGQVAELPRDGAGAVDVELFAGAGGLALGLARAGLVPRYLYEMNKHCCRTLRANHGRQSQQIEGDIHEEDVSSVDWAKIARPVRLLSGGPPCQPFSLAGRHRANSDERNQFPATLRAVRALNPQAVLLENVPGLVRPSFKPYLDYITRQLAYPSVAPRRDELWQDHDARLITHETARRRRPEYYVGKWLLNAADYGVPQARVRLVLLAIRGDFSPPEPPQPTHSKNALMHAQETGAYWKERGLRRRRRDEWPRRLSGQRLSLEGMLPWKTVRDALTGLPPPKASSTEVANHFLIPGARMYHHHSGSELDWPAKTIKAGVHGVAGGENILLLTGASFRYFTLREMARLQCFPDSFTFQGPRSRVIGQIGNAVPCELGRVLGEVVANIVGEVVHEPRARTTVG